MTPAERLLAAADLLEKRAGEATGGPWNTKAELDGMLAGRATVVHARARRVVTVGQTRTHHYDAAEANAAYIATMHPEVGKALGVWLRTTGNDAEANLTWDSLDCPNCGTACGGHPFDWWCDHCGGGMGLEGKDACVCYKPALALADLLLAGAS